MSRNILVLYDDRELYTSNIRDHVLSLEQFSENNIFYAGGCAWSAPPNFPFDVFDAIVVHYSLRLAVDWFIHPLLPRLLTNFSGLKTLFIQDEYQGTNTTCKWIEQLGFQVVFTCIPTPYMHLVYPPNRFGHVQFINVLTGYVPIELEQEDHRRPLQEREIWIGYRGRSSKRYYLGLLGQEKVEIGVRMKAVCLDRGIPSDIEWTEEKRLYGPAWYEFISSCRTQLGVESGCNVIDPDGHIQQNVERAVRDYPDATFEEIYPKYVQPHEGPMKMNMISPRVFEAISLGSGLILFEGNYSNVVEPYEHFIPLRKDFSNVDDVLARVSDLDYLEKMTMQAYEAIVRSGKYSYRNMVKLFDGVVRERAGPPSGRKFVMSIFACGESGNEELLHPKTFVLTQPVHVPAHYFDDRENRIFYKKFRKLFGYPRRIVRLFLPAKFRRLLRKFLRL